MLGLNCRGARHLVPDEDIKFGRYAAQVIDRPKNRHTPPKSHWSASRPALPAMAGKPKGAQQLIAMKHKAAAAATKARSPSHSKPIQSSWQKAKLASLDKVHAGLVRVPGASMQSMYLCFAAGYCLPQQSCQDAVVAAARGLLLDSMLVSAWHQAWIDSCICCQFDTDML